MRAFAILKKTYPDVGLLIIGAGEERSKLERLAAEFHLKDVHFLGGLVDPKDTAAYFSLADLMVIPRLVGLVIVHGFAHGLPLVTTQHDFHSPEIECLTPENGLIVPQNEQTYSDYIRAKLAAMREAAEETSEPQSVCGAFPSCGRLLFNLSTYKGSSHSTVMNHKILRP